VARRRLLASVPGAKALRHTIVKSMKACEEERVQRRLALKDRIRRRGLAGQKLGKHTVPEGDVEVQLGEDLSESFRSIKVHYLFSITCGLSNPIIARGKPVPGSVPEHAAACSY
jgi:hypothetical protein